MSEPFPCMLTVLIQWICSPTAVQTVTVSWMPPVLGQWGTNFRTGHPSFSLFSCFMLTLFSFYVTSHVFEWAPATDCLGLCRLKCGLQYHSTSCYLEQMERVQLCCEEVPPTVTTAPCLQSVTVCCWYSLGLTTFRTHIWSAGQCWLHPSISSCFFNPPKKSWREREGETE